MTVSLPDIFAFLAVYETGGVNAASRRMGLSRSVVSSRVADLEASIGTHLFIRSTKAMTPTDAGELFYQRTSSIVRDLEDAVNDVRPEEAGLSGSFRVTAPISATLCFFQQPLIDFGMKHKELRVSINLNDEMVDLASGAYDMALRIGRLADSDLIAKKLAESPRTLCASPGYIKEQGTPTSLDDLSAHETIGYANVPVSQHWEFSGGASGETVSVRVTPRFSSNNGETIRDAAVSGAGVCLVPEFLVSRQLKEGTLVRLLSDTPPTADTVYAVYMPGRANCPKGRAFLDHLAPYFERETFWRRCS